MSAAASCEPTHKARDLICLSQRVEAWRYCKFIKSHQIHGVIPQERHHSHYDAVHWASIRQVPKASALRVVRNTTIRPRPPKRAGRAARRAASTAPLPPLQMAATASQLARQPKALGRLQRLRRRAKRGEGVSDRHAGRYKAISRNESSCDSDNVFDGS